MLNVYKVIDNILEQFNVPFFDGFTNFGDNEPELYIVYNLYDTPSLSGDGELKTLQYTITINIIGKKIQNVDELHKQVFNVLQKNGFIYAGCNYTFDTDYPEKTRRILDFHYTENLNNTESEEK